MDCCNMLLVVALLLLIQTRVAEISCLYSFLFGNIIGVEFNQNPAAYMERQAGCFS